MFLTLLKRNGYEVINPPDWDGHEEDLLVFDQEDGKYVELWDYVNNKMSKSKHELFNLHIFHNTYV